MNVSPESHPPPLDDSFLVGITPTGMQALTNAVAPEECDMCRRTLQTGDAFFRVTLGMDDMPSYVGAPLARESTVEETSELIVCEACEPAVAEPIGRLLSTLWGMCKPDPANEDEEPTVPVEPLPEEPSPLDPAAPTERST